MPKKQREPRKLIRIPLKEELMALVGGDVCEALLLQQMIYWSERIKDVDRFLEEERSRIEQNREEESPSDIKSELQNGWIWKKADELVEELLSGFNKKYIERRMKNLVDKKFLQRRRNPKYKWDRTWQYRVDIIYIQQELNKLGYALEGYTLLIPNDTESQGKDEESLPKDGESFGKDGDILPNLQMNPLPEANDNLTFADDTESLGGDGESHHTDGESYQRDGGSYQADTESLQRSMSVAAIPEITSESLPGNYDREFTQTSSSETYSGTPQVSGKSTRYETLGDDEKQKILADLKSSTGTQYLITQLRKMGASDDSMINEIILKTTLKFDGSITKKSVDDGIAKVNKALQRNVTISSVTSFVASKIADSSFEDNITNLFRNAQNAKYQGLQEKANEINSRVDLTKDIYSQ